MLKMEWGAKRTCLNCGTRFYDLQRLSVPCPKCGTMFEVHAAPTRRRGKVAAVDLTKDLLLDDVVTDLEIGGDLGADLIEDTDELSEGLDDLSDMMADGSDD